MNPLDLGLDLSQNIAHYRVQLLPSLVEYLNHLLDQEKVNTMSRRTNTSNNAINGAKTTANKEIQTDLTFAVSNDNRNGIMLPSSSTVRKEHEEDAASFISFETCKSTHKSQVRSEITIYKNHKEFYWDIHVKDEKSLYESNFFTFLNLTWRLVFIFDVNGKHVVKLVCVTNDAGILEPIIINRCLCSIHSLLKPMNVKQYNNLLFSALPKTEISNAGCNVNKQFNIEFTGADNINSYIENEKLKISVTLSSSH